MNTNPPNFVKKDECPLCFYKIDSAIVATHDRRPTVGDLSVCLNCAGLLRFDKDMNLVQLTDDEYENLPFCVKEEITRARSAIRQVKLSRPPTVVRPDDGFRRSGD